MLAGLFFGHHKWRPYNDHLFRDSHPPDIARVYRVKNSD